MNTAQAALIRYNNAISKISEEERILRKELQETNKQILENAVVLNKSADAAKHAETGNKTTSSEKQRKEEEKIRNKRERAEKKAQAEALKRQKNTDKEYVAELNVQLATLDYLYSNGLVSYKSYLQRKETLQLNSIDKRKKLWGEESTEARMLADDEVKIRQKTIEALGKLNEQEIEHERVAKEAKINAMFYDESSDIFLNESAMNEALFRNDIDALNKRLSLYKTGTEEWLSLKAEIEEKQNQHQYDLQAEHDSKLIDLRKEYLNQGNAMEEQIEMNWLDKFYQEGLLNEEEYQQAKMAIRERYASMPSTADDTTHNTAKSMLNAAEKSAGPQAQYITDGSDSGITAISSIFAIVQYRKKVNEDLKKLYGEDYENSAAYNEAKKMNNNAMFQEIISAASVAYSSINNIMSAASAYSQACSDYEVAKIKANYDKQIEAAGNNSAKREKLEKERDKKINEAKNKANKKAMAIEIAQALASTAMNAISAYGAVLQPEQPWTVPLAIAAAVAATASGMLQVATIKKQHQAEAAGYYEGGFTGPGDYRREAGVVHAGEFVANHKAVNNPQLLPALQLIDQAQRNNTVASLTATDVSRAVGGGNTAVVAPVVNVTTDNEELNRVIKNVVNVVDSLNSILASGINANVYIDGEYGFDAQYRKYQRLKG